MSVASLPGISQGCREGLLCFLIRCVLQSYGTRMSSIRHFFRPQTAAESMEAACWQPCRPVIFDHRLCVSFLENMHKSRGSLAFASAVMPTTCSSESGTLAFQIIFTFALVAKGVMLPRAALEGLGERQYRQ